MMKTCGSSTTNGASGRKLKKGLMELQMALQRSPAQQQNQQQQFECISRFLLSFVSPQYPLLLTFLDSVCLCPFQHEHISLHGEKQVQSNTQVLSSTISHGPTTKIIQHSVWIMYWKAFCELISFHAQVHTNCWNFVSLLHIFPLQPPLQSFPYGGLGEANLSGGEALASGPVMTGPQGSLL